MLPRRQEERLIPSFFVSIFGQDGTNALMAAASNGHFEAAESLVKAKAALNAQNSDGHSALMFAYNGRAQVGNLTYPFRVTGFGPHRCTCFLISGYKIDGCV